MEPQTSVLIELAYVPEHTKVYKPNGVKPHTLINDVTLYYDIGNTKGDIPEDMVVLADDNGGLQLVSKYEKHRVDFNSFMDATNFLEDCHLRTSSLK